MNPSTETAIFALGNFWEPEYEFSKIPGVIGTEAGYSGGTSAHPTYHDTGDHAEAVQVEFDPRAVSYEELLDKFWGLHDPTAEYVTKFQSAIFYFDGHQHRTAEASKAAKQAQLDQPIVTRIAPAGKFYPAEQYNQHYIAKLRGEL